MVWFYANDTLKAIISDKFACTAVVDDAVSTWPLTCSEMDWLTDMFIVY